MKPIIYSVFLFFCVIAGMLFFAIKNEFIIFNIATITQEVSNEKPASKKEVHLIFWQNNQWKAENHDLLWTHNKQQDLHCLINTWLTLLHEENNMEKKVTLHTVLLATSDQTAYLSFDSDPLSKESATTGKLFFIEGLLKTIRENDISLQEVQFLVQHEQMQDPHLDFSKPWPINGFFQG
ncbi:MAG: hypothetical protein WCD44_00070 [Candidatus Babeliales bacterium]